MFCRNCGAQNEDGVQFCAACGTSMIEEPAPVAPVAEQSVYQQPVYQQPAPVAPVAEQPAYQQPAQPAYQQPAQPVYQQPVQPVYQQPVYGQPVYQQPVQNAKAPAHGLAIASLVLGLAGIVVAAVICGVLAIIFAGVAKSKGNRSGMATAGIVLGVIDVAIWVLGYLVFPSMFLNLF